MRSFLGLAPILCAGLVAACAGHPVPTDRMASSEAAIRAAREVGAERKPQAALYLTLAQEGVEEARELIDDGENERAEYVLLRADADAELAIALSREVDMRARAMATQREAQMLEQQLRAQR